MALANVVICMSENALGKAVSGTSANDKDSSVTCPTCDRDDFSSEYGLKQHHAKAHNESLTEVVVECDHCGDDIERQQSMVEEMNFCDTDCHGAWISENRRGANHPNTTQVTVNCEACGTELERPKWHREMSEQHFCDKSCHGEWLSENNTGEAHQNYDSLTVACEWCDTEFERQRHHAENGSLDFCGSECRAAWLSEHTSGEDSRHWKGGHPRYYGPNWDEQREKALERDQYRCQRCGCSGSDVDRELDVHHIKRLGWFQDEYDAPEWYEKGNDVDNLTSLCRSCHHRWEGIPLRPDNRGAT